MSNVKKKNILLPFILILFFSTIVTSAIIYTVGVQVGDWANYASTITWQSTDSYLIDLSERVDWVKEMELAINREWFKIEFQNVSKLNIIVLQTDHFEDGTERTNQVYANWTELDFSAYLIPSELNEGDLLPGFGTLNKTVLVSYADVARNVNYLKFSIPFYGTNLTMTFHWDRVTGILCEQFVEISTPTYAVAVSMLVEMTETNLWFRPFWEQWWFWLIFIVAFIMTFVVAYINLKRKAKNSALSSIYNSYSSSINE